MSEPLPRAKVWRHRRFVSEHAFDKLRALDCTFAEFVEALDHAEVMEEHVLDDGMKELLLTLDWRRPLHVVVVVDDHRSEERLITVYVPDDDRWSHDYRRRR